MEKNKLILIEKGLTLNNVANLLKSEQIIRSKTLFIFLSRTYYSEKSLKAGEYYFKKKMSLLKTIDLISNGNTHYRKITFPEGLTLEEIEILLNNNEFLSGKVNFKDISEGMLFPDTYFFSRNDDVNSIIFRMREKMKNKINEILITNKNIFDNIEDLINFSSIIESEAKLKEEKFLVSSVFHNRLKKGMRLQSDPTVLYGKNFRIKEKKKNILKKDLIVDHPWNTYTRKGLPKTAICNPGMESINAALNPKKTNFLYFVSDGRGGHRFSETLKEHNANVKIWKKTKKLKDD